jgi:hypothetical protein
MLRDLLRAEGFRVGREHITTLMRRMGIMALYREPNTSKRAPGHTIYPYRLRTLAITRSNHVWAMDISYIPDGAQLRLPGGRDRPAQPQGARLAAVDLDGHGKGCRRDNVFVQRLWRSIKYEEVLPACLRDRKRRTRRHRPLQQLLQHSQAALEPSSSNFGRGVLRVAASAFGRRSLTPQDPLENLRDLSRSAGPALLQISSRSRLQTSASASAAVLHA